MTTLSPALLADAPAPGTLVTADGRTLPLRATRLVVRSTGGLAQVRLIQTFANPYAEPLHVTYQLPLPADAAVGGFAFQLGAQRIAGEIDRRAAARERFEQAIASGRTAALLEQDRSSLFTQELGNLPPGAQLEAQIDIDQPLQWVEGSWQWRFPTTVAPRYLGGTGAVPDAARLAVDVIENPASIAPRLTLELMIGDALAAPLDRANVPHSPSHALDVAATAGGTRVAFAAPAGHVPMDRDVVVSWAVATPSVGVTLRTFRAEQGALAGQAFAQLTLVPPTIAAETPRLSRDLIVLLDISGSMSGAPLQQAQLVTTELIRSLSPTDRLELIAFANEPRAWARGPKPATPANVASALSWLNALQASGSTEMHTAILAALASLRDGAQRQVVLVTDGLIGFEQQIVGTIKSALPAHSRVHVVGVGSAPNRTLTRGASRAGRGLEVLIGLGEDAAPAARRLLARTALPLLDELSVSGSAVLGRAPQALPDVFAGAPARLALRLNPAGGSLVVRGVTAAGAFVHELSVPPVVAGGDAALARMFAREAVEDLEVELAAGRSADVDASIEQLGLSHQIATRLTSWVAIASATVDPRDPARHVLVPQELPHGMSIEQLGLRACSAGAPSQAMPCMPAAAPVELSRRQAPGRMKESKREEERAECDDVAVPPPPMDAPAKAKKSLLGNLFGSKPKPSAEGAAAKSADGVAAGSGGGVPRATLRLRNASEWVFELSGLADWQLPGHVVVVFADGSEVEFTVDVARTTAAGAIGAGALVRLTLRAAVPANAQPRLLRLHHGTQTLELALS